MPKHQGKRPGHRQRGIDYAEAKNKATRKDVPVADSSGYDQRTPRSHSELLQDIQQDNPAVATRVPSNSSVRIKYQPSPGAPLPEGRFKYCCLRYPNFVKPAMANKIVDRYLKAEAVSPSSLCSLTTAWLLPITQGED